MNPKTFEYQTEGFTYHYLPEDPNNNDDLADLLDQAVKYSLCATAFISNKLFEHLKEELKFNDDPDEIEDTFIYKLQEGNIYINKRNTGYVDILLFISPGSIEEELFNDIFSKSDFTKRGLQYFLDPNHGGSISPRNLEIASLIIYG